jgi:hypothetical protein
MLLKKILRKTKAILIKIRNVFYLFFGFVSFLRKKKIIFMVNGGLGSQMWQYAVGQAIEKKSGIPVYYDIEFYKNGGKDCSGLFNRNWDLERVFPSVTVKKANVYDVFFYKRFLNKEYTANNRVHIVVDEILTSKKSRYLGEHYDNVKYFDFIEKHLREQFVFDTTGFSENTLKMAETIKNTPGAVALQVRRGDFVTVGADKVTPPEYFYNAIDRINNDISKQNSAKIVFFVFSNDIPFCKNIFSIRNDEFVFVDINDNDSGAEDMYLMSLCRHFIISASSFGWWGAFLSSVDKNKIVITPEIWRTYESEEVKGRMLLNGWMGV